MKKTNNASRNAFALPTVLIASVIMLTVLLVSVSSTSTLRNAVATQYYNKLTQASDDAGLTYAKACLAANGGIPQWNDTNKLKPDTDCSGVQLSSCPADPATASCHFVTVVGNIRSTFTVGAPELYSNNKAKSITVQGVTSLLKTSDSSVWRSYKQNTNSTYNYDPAIIIQGPLSPGTVVNDATVGTVAWANPTNARVSDNVYAFSSHSGSTTTNYLKATNFGFSIPAGATINGITVEIEGNVNASFIVQEVKIVRADGTISSTNKVNKTDWTSTDAYYTYGSSYDLWGETWDSTKINNANFGVVFSTMCNNTMPTKNAYVDHIRIKVSYST